MSWNWKKKKQKSTCPKNFFNGKIKNYKLLKYLNKVLKTKMENVCFILEQGGLIRVKVHHLLLPDNTDCMVINDDSEQYSIMKFSIENAWSMAIIISSTPSINLKYFNKFIQKIEKLIYVKHFFLLDIIWGLKHFTKATMTYDYQNWYSNGYFLYISNV